MKYSSLVGLTGTTAALVLATGFAIGGEGRTGQKEAASTAGISIEEAIKAATQKHPGKVLEAELEVEDGNAVWELEILTADGKKMEVQVDSRTGEVLASEEDEDEDAKDREQERDQERKRERKREHRS